MEKKEMGPRARLNDLHLSGHVEHSEGIVDPEEIRPLRLLVVDDDPGVQELLAEVLTGAGYRVETAFNSDEAVGRVAEEKYDGMVLDLVLPEEDGLALYDRVLEISGTFSNLQAAGYVYDFVSRFIRAEWRAYNAGKNLGRRRRTDYALGVIEGFRSKLKSGNETKPLPAVLLRLDGDAKEPEPLPRTYAPGVVDEGTGRAHGLGGLDDRIAAPGGDDAGDDRHVGEIGDLVVFHTRDWTSSA